MARKPTPPPVSSRGAQPPKQRASGRRRGRQPGVTDGRARVCFRLDRWSKTRKVVAGLAEKTRGGSPAPQRSSTLSFLRRASHAVRGGLCAVRRDARPAPPPARSRARAADRQPRRRVQHGRTARESVPRLAVQPGSILRLPADRALLMRDRRDVPRRSAVGPRATPVAGPGSAPHGVHPTECGFVARCHYLRPLIRHPLDRFRERCSKIAPLNPSGSGVARP